jgi:hypothetical protein
MKEKKDTVATARVSLSQAEFVTAWQKHASLKELCDATGLKPKTAAQRSKAFRKAGVPLKQYPRAATGSKIDVAAMCELIKQLDAAAAVEVTE